MIRCTWGTGVIALGEGQGEATGESSAIVLISGVPAFDVFGLFRGDIPLMGLLLGESPTMGLPLGLLVTPGLGCFVDESRRFWFLKEVLKLSCRSNVVAMLSLQKFQKRLVSNFWTFWPVTLHPPEILDFRGTFPVSVFSPLLLGRLTAADCIVSRFSAPTVSCKIATCCF